MNLSAYCAIFYAIPANGNIFRTCARIFAVRQGRIGRRVLVAVRKVKPVSALRQKDRAGAENVSVRGYKYNKTVVLNNYSPNIGKTIRKNKTLYVLDNGIANAMLRLPEIDETRTGHIVESICARDALAACENNLWSLFYWREKGVEVDLVLDRKTDVLPIEVKYRTNVKETSLFGISAFRKIFAKMKIPVSIVITRDRLDRNQFERDHDTLYIPFWLAR